MNDLVSKTVFGALIAKQRGIEQSEAMKIGLLSAIDNSKNLAVSLLTAKVQADNQAEIQDLKDNQQMLNDGSLRTRRELEDLKTATKALVQFIFDASNDATAIQGFIDNHVLLVDFKPLP
jgi:hypothetical protein